MSFPRDLDKIDNLMQEVVEQQDAAQEISEALSQRAGLGDDFDEVGEARGEGGSCGFPPSTADRAPQAFPQGSSTDT